MIRNLLIIALGGGIGSMARYLLSVFVQNKFDIFFPFGTLTVNVVGSFILGMLMGMADRGSLISQEWKLFLAVGLCGGFTTFSTFASENLALLRDGEYLYAIGYMGLSVFLGITLVYFGFAITR
jgi:CrcB protein